ncbi:BofC C-terminal domain-containing protein [Mesobacillus zeae]|uniref:Regulator n=1 Tax=Mesobacillus zeae TaxID=1917180 RepID=A0A398B738_9BACI|nr:BofC C-terminal domain-containing protein [Mesobacillus zeae]RID83720.1 regulator [Mesobacillus zeae]
MEYTAVVKNLVFFAILGLGLALSGEPAEAVQPEQGTETVSPWKMTVILERCYLDGDKSEETIQETIWSTKDFWARYESWELVKLEENKAVFRQNVDDISPLLKANGYFGLSEDGVLTIFNGRPGQSKAIHSFFQIDVGKLESRALEQLQSGIPIKSKDSYVKVLETFRAFTRTE